MATVRDCGTVTTTGKGRPREARPSRLSITLADLITAVQDVVGPGDDELVVATVRHLLGAARFLGCGAGPPGPRFTRGRGLGTGVVSRV
jgi:hypothetical protein